MNQLIINQDDIIHNIGIIKTKFNVKIIAVIKCDGYGFGLLYMANLLREQEFSTFAVTEISDLIALRKNGFNQDILILRSTAILDDAQKIVEFDGIANIGSLLDAEILNKAAKNHGKTVRAHISIDTGMARDGFSSSQTGEIHQLYNTYHNISFCGIFTHFNSSFTNVEKTRLQLNLFLKTVNFLQNKGINVGDIHAANSSAAFNLPESVLSCVRIGSAFIGRLATVTELKSVGIIRTNVTGLKTIKKGEEVGYLGAFIARRDMTLAVLPIGTHDGFGVAPASDINNFKVFLFGLVSSLKKLIQKKSPFTVEIAGKTYPTVGHIGSNHSVVDVTGANITVGETVFINQNPMHINENMERFVTLDNG